MLQSLFESLVYSGFNFFLAMPILCVGLFDKDASNATTTECHKLYAVGRLGMDLNLRVSGRELDEDEDGLEEGGGGVVIACDICWFCLALRCCCVAGAESRICHFVKG